MTASGRWAAGAAVVLAAALTSATANAQPASGARAKAELRFRQGQEFFKAGDYDHALAEYDAAFALSREPLLIFNIALCHDRAGRPEQALEAFERYLELAPRGEVADEARENVARLTRLVDEIRAERAEEEARRAERARRAESSRRARASARARREAEARAGRRRRIEERAESLERRSRLERWSGAAVAALGAVSLGVATKYGLDARSAEADVGDHDGPWTDDLLARDAEGRSSESRMFVFAGIGGAAILGGAVLYLLGRHDRSQADRLRLELRPAPSGGAISIGGRF